MRVRIIGDIHGNIAQYKEIIEDASQNDVTFTIQIGDFGFRDEHNWFLENMDVESNKILFGNHDYYPYLYREHSFGDYDCINGIFGVRGADSIDRAFRLEGRDWFREEEMSLIPANKAIDLYDHVLPEIVLSHDAPQSVVERMENIYSTTFTRKLLQELLDRHQPKYWFYGHWHNRRVFNMPRNTKTTFVNLEEFGWIDIEVKNNEITVLF